MHVHIHLRHKSWQTGVQGTLHARGAAFIGMDRLPSDAWPQQLPAADGSPEAWQQALTSLNGFFALIRPSATATVAVVDRIRSIPLFYGQKDGQVYISDDAEWVRQHLDNRDMDPFAKEEFQLAGYVTGRDTLYPDLKQLQAGESLHVSHEGGRVQLILHRWYRFLHHEPDRWNEPTLRKELDACAERCIQRLVTYADGRKIVIPLSGGYDSRLIALLLKRVGYDRILCFTYGLPGNHEAKISQQVASELNLPWHFVEYSPEKWRKAWNTDERVQYQKWGSGWTSLAHVQDWLAVREMHAQGAIEPDSVFVPGHTGDFISGGHIPYSFKTGADVGFKAVVDAIESRHLSLVPLRRISTRPADEWRSRVLDRCEAKPHNAVDAADTFEKWEWQERQAKFIVNSVRVYESYDYDWWVPLWDAEFMQFWEQVPLELRLGQTWYQQYVETIYAAAGGASGLKNSSDRSGYKGKIPTSVKRLIKGLFPVLKCINVQPSGMAGRYSLEMIGALRKEGYIWNGIVAKVFIDELDAWRN